MTLHLYKAQDGLDAYAIANGTSRECAKPSTWLAQKGFGSDFEKVWSLELQSASEPSGAINWESVLDRAIEAYHLSDPVISQFEWPQLAT